MLGTDLERAPTRFLQRVQSIFHDLDEGLEQLVAVALDARQVCLDHSLDADFLIVPLQLAHLHAPLQEHA